MDFVLDASVGAGWIIKNQVSTYSEAAKVALLANQAHAPALWWLEITNMLRTGCQRRSITATEAQGFIKSLQAFPILFAPIEGNASDLFALALRYRLTTYDATYLDLALRLQLPIATRDEALREAALASGVGVWMPA